MITTKYRNTVIILCAVAVVTCGLAFGKLLAQGNTFGAISFAILGVVFLGGFAMLRRVHHGDR